MSKREVKLLDVQGQIWEEIQVPLRVLGGKLSKVVTMADKVFFRDGEAFGNAVYRAPLPYLEGI